MSLTEDVEAIRAENKVMIDRIGSQLSTAIEVHAAVCMMGTGDGIKDTRERAIQLFTDMLNCTERACAAILERGQQEPK